MAISKVVYGGNTLIDLTADTVSADKVLAGIKAHGADGEAITGTCAYDADTTDATVAGGRNPYGQDGICQGLEGHGHNEKQRRHDGSYNNQSGAVYSPAGVS